MPVEEQAGGFPAVCTTTQINHEPPKRRGIHAREKS